MTEKLYDNSKLISTEAEVCLVEETDGGFDVATSKTVFFPGGGGQDPDTGSLNGQKVTLVYEKDGYVFHRVAQKPEVGDIVVLETDRAKRESDAEIHTGEHILSGLALKLFGAKNVGFHMGEDFATADFNIPLSEDQLEKLEDAVNSAIRANTPVRITYPESEELDSLPLRKRPETNEPIRVVEVEGCDLCACCGTHVLFTGGVGLLKILFSEKLRGGTRVAFVCGGRAMKIFCGEHKQITSIAQSFSTKNEFALEQVKKQTAELEAANRKITELLGSLAKAEALRLWNEAAELDGEKEVSAEVALGADALIALSKELCALGRVHAFLFAEGRYVLASSEDSVFDLKAKNTELCALGARGGGRGHLFSGKLG
ncbi:MAG: alanyl-tRNA editing protein [Oscillospiraceae bacterium]|nr:alanyl-tRNA editing protein [Oscillospiraceae bacterium]